MKIAIWTTRTPKIEWVMSGVESCPYLDESIIEYITAKVPSWISDMPLNIWETMLWAKNRAQNLYKTWIFADFYVGIEWWTTEIWRKKYIFWAVYIEDSLWEWHYWFSPMMEVPEIIEEKIYKEWLELWVVMWELSWKINLKSENWSMWAWSDDMLTRKNEFKSAFQAAISPFFNKYYNL